MSTHVFCLLSPVQVRVAAAYLPQFVRTQIEYPFASSHTDDDDGVSVMDRHWDHWLMRLLMTDASYRFVRERPNEAIALERYLADRISRLLTAVFLVSTIPSLTYTSRH